MPIHQHLPIMCWTPLEHTRTEPLLLQNLNYRTQNLQMNDCIEYMGEINMIRLTLTGLQHGKIPFIGDRYNIRLPGNR